MLRAMTALGAHDPMVATVGPLTITERVDVAMASVAARRGQDLGAAAQAAGIPLPGPLQHQAGETFAAFWVAPEMWFVTAPFATHEDIAGHMQAVFGAAASITEQTDAWVILDLTASDLAAILERLCNVDFRTVPPGYATRTVIDHLGVYLIKQNTGARLLGPRSSAESLVHALQVAAAAI